MAPTPPELSRTPTMGERFGLNLWRARRRADLSQSGLADFAGLSLDAIWKIENGQRLPRLDTILRLAAGTSASPCVLLEGLEWLPGHHVDGAFYVEHPAADLRRRSARG